MKSFWQRCLIVSVLFCLSTVAANAVDFKPAATRPDDAIVLFDGQGICRFVSKDGTPADKNWKVENGYLVAVPKEVRSNHISSTVKFQDADIHVEFMTSDKAHGNSGLYIHGLYELQIINPVRDDEPLTNSISGALYGIHAPQVRAALKPGQWQVYDVRFRSPLRNAQGKVIQSGSITAWLNGKLVLDNVHFDEPYSKYHPYVYRSTDYLRGVYNELIKTNKGPLFLQEHDNPCRFRNVWIRPIDPIRPATH